MEYVKNKKRKLKVQIDELQNMKYKNNIIMFQHNMQCECENIIYYNYTYETVVE